MTTLLQISDTHIVRDGALVSDQLETAGPLARLVDRIAGMRDQIGPVAALLVSGDLSEDGSPESYDHFKQILAPLDLPLLVIPGNHDARDPLRAAFAEDGYLPTTGKLNWTRRIGDVLAIGLDTLVEGQGGGVLDTATLDFLRDSLREASGVPVLLSMHHPPFQTGIRFMDDIGLQGPDGLRQVLSDQTGEVRIVCGHIHCMMVATVGAHIAMSAPSTCSSFSFDMRANAPVGYLDQADGFLIHRWDNGFRSVRVGADVGAGPFPF